MAFDAHKNLAISAVATAPTPATSGTSLIVTAGHGARFPAPPFNVTIWPANAPPDPLNAEVARVTARATDTLTITRAQEGSTARLIGVGDLIAQTITAKTLTDLETQAALLAAANVFTQPQTLQGVNPALILYEPAQPVNARRWKVVQTAANWFVQPADDTDAGLFSALALTRAGDAYISRDILEKGRVAPLGHWIAQPFTAAHFSSTSGTFVVVAGDVIVNKYTLIGKTLIWCLHLLGGTVGGSSAYLQVVLPGGLTTPINAVGPLDGYAAGGTPITAGTWLTSGSNFLYLQYGTVPGTPWPTGVCLIRMTAMFEIS